jgi:hypothetical protein
MTTKLVPESAAGELTRLRGAVARRSHYTASHDRLTIEVTAASSQGPRYLNFVLCDRISTPASWRFTRPELHAEPPNHLRFTDEDVVIVCEECSIQDEDPNRRSQ